MEVINGRTSIECCLLSALSLRLHWKLSRAKATAEIRVTLMIQIVLGLVHNTCRSVSRLTMVVVVSERAEALSPHLERLE
jgi:hypothetical protein